MRYVLLALLTGAVLSAPAQPSGSAPVRSRMTVDSLRVMREGDTLRVVLRLNLRDVRLGDRSRLTLTPVLQDSTRRVPLPAIVVAGRNCYKQDRRLLALDDTLRRQRAQRRTVYDVLQGYGEDADRETAYAAAVAFEAWMEHARLDWEQRIEGGTYTLTLSDVASLATPVPAAAPEPETFQPELAYRIPVPERKNRVAQTEMHLDFAPGSTVLRADYHNNARELERLYGMLDSLHGNPDVTLHRLTLRGYASPEGSTATNERLSGLRAEGLKKYLAARYRTSGLFSGVELTAESGGENWEGLATVLATRPFAEREAVLTILDSLPAARMRKRELQRLNGGATWSLLLREVYPLLRVVSVRADYTLAGFDVERAREVLDTRPGDLTLHELWTVARSAGSDTAAFRRTLLVAAAVYPENDTANLNAAVAALEAGDRSAAERYLAKVGVHTPEYDNTLGALLLSEGERRAAGMFFRAAAEAGLAEGRRNLERLRATDGEESDRDTARPEEASVR